MDDDLRYFIFKVDGRYKVVSYDWYQTPASSDNFICTNWYVYGDEHKADQVVQVLNNLTDPYAIQCFVDLVTLSTI